MSVYLWIEFLEVLIYQSLSALGKLYLVKNFNLIEITILVAKNVNNNP
jgi:hypothetical protein